MRSRDEMSAVASVQPDKLSIDSKTSTKIVTKRLNTSSTIQFEAQRPHFRIDWRQLTYYHNERRSLLGDLFWRRAGKSRAADATSSSWSEGTQSRSQLGDCEGRQEARLGRKRILNSLDGCFKSGELNAILGPSGAGKSTFLSALFGNKQESAYGQTRVTWFRPDGRQMAPSEADRQRTIRIAFLPQNDHLLNHLTVYEALMFASKIKNPARSNGKQFHLANVRRVAKMLKLTDCLSTRCGRLSGGQYKRVSIGQELLSQPDVIILDEPTSGLDAMTCLTLVRVLKSIVMKQPISIVLTIHQPDIDVFNLFDQVYVIAQGGMAIYEGPPQGVVPTLAQVSLFMPCESYNPARFIVENAFVADLEAATAAPGDQREGALSPAAACAFSDSSSDDDDDHVGDDAGAMEICKVSLDGQKPDAKSFLHRSISSLTEAAKSISMAPPVGQKLRESGRRPLLNIGIQTADGKLITSDVLAMHQQSAANKAQMERIGLLRRLNELQKEKYYAGARRDTTSDMDSTYLSTENLTAAQQERPSSQATTAQRSAGDFSTASSSSSSSSAASTSSLSTYAEARSQVGGRPLEASDDEAELGRPTETAARLDCPPDVSRAQTPSQAASTTAGGQTKLRHRFDKRLSAKHNQSRQRGHPTWRHSLLLTHRTWLSIVRDPIFFGIQFTMHTTIPILLALIFGSAQEEGCPQVGNFDLVEFAYQPGQADFIQTTMRSIRQSVGNIGIIFFEMFVLSFAINCITALVFPLDMHVLLKEYRNGWYSLRSYFFGRTLADLPVPVVLHSLAMSILYYLTGQPLTWWRFCAIIAIVILASLIAQSVGLTIGALLMRSSQSAVLAAAGIVAPFFALSGFIVRIHTLPAVARFFAQTSYLYHLLNGFIILRYGFGRCPCEPEDFERADGHQIPANLKTMASMWIGTYSNEYELETRHLGAAAGQANRTNVDPNIDIVDKLVAAFKMANSFGHRVESCADVLPYAMLDFNLKDSDIWWCCASLALMLLASRCITFGAIYYKIRSSS